MSIIKPKRGTGSPAGSIETNEIAMDTASKTLYVSTDGSDAEILANNTEYFLANNTISGITNSAPGYNSILNAIRADTGGSYSRTAMEVIRDLGSDGATSGIDPRGAMFGFTIWNDAGNTNGAISPAQFLGGIQAKSGSGTNDNASPHWIEAFTYNSSFAENKLWDGTMDEFNIYPELTVNNKSLIDATAGGLTDPILHLNTNSSNWNATQLLCSDSNGNVFSQVGRHNTGSDYYQWNITLDPDNTHGRTGVTTYAGDYFVAFEKNYSDPANTTIKQNIFGAHNGFVVSVYDDNNSGSPNPGPLPFPGYGFKPFIIRAENFEVKAKSSDTSVATALTIDNTSATFEVPVQFPSYDLNAGPLPSSPAAGMQVYNTDTNKMAFYNGTAWTDL